MVKFSGPEAEHSGKNSTKSRVPTDLGHSGKNAQKFKAPRGGKNATPFRLPNWAPGHPILCAMSSGPTGRETCIATGTSSVISKRAAQLPTVGSYETRSGSSVNVDNTSGARASEVATGNVSSCEDNEGQR